MNILITWQMVAWMIALVIAWTGFLLTAIKWLLNRQITALETRLTDAESVATEAQKSVSVHKESVSEKLATMRLEFSQKLVCGNHHRMEANDAEISKRLDMLHGDIRELAGGVKRLTHSFDMVQEHLMSGGTR